jgi:hypothetical protein
MSVNLFNSLTKQVVEKLIIELVQYVMLNPESVILNLVQNLIRADLIQHIME